MFNIKFNPICQRFTLLTVSTSILVACFAWSDDNSIIRFSINQVNGEINKTNQTIVINLPLESADELKTLKPDIEVAKYATVKPASGETINFSTPQTFVVTAEDGSTATYKVQVNAIITPKTPVTSVIPSTPTFPTESVTSNPLTTPSLTTTPALPLDTISSTPQAN